MVYAFPPEWGKTERRKETEISEVHKIHALKFASHCTDGVSPLGTARVKLER